MNKTLLFLAICSVCLDGESEDTNDLLYCDKCHTPVHQVIFYPNYFF